nr:uncharacterized protein LOC113703753 [Coffea arabica]
MLLQPPVLLNQLAALHPHKSKVWFPPCCLCLQKSSFLCTLVLQSLTCAISSYDSGSRTNNLCSQKILTGGKFCFLKVKASASKRSSDEPRRKPNSLLCADCNGNGAVPCSQCKGNGVNSADYFNGKFKAGDSCWLCGGKKNMLCGNCNGAGFIGGFMTSSDT